MSLMDALAGWVEAFLSKRFDGQRMVAWGSGKPAGLALAALVQLRLAATAGDGRFVARPMPSLVMAIPPSSSFKPVRAIRCAC